MLFRAAAKSAGTSWALQLSSSLVSDVTPESPLLPPDGHFCRCCRSSERDSEGLFSPSGGVIITVAIAFFGDAADAASTLAAPPRGDVTADKFFEPSQIKDSFSAEEEEEKDEDEGRE